MKNPKKAQPVKREVPRFVQQARPRPVEMLFRQTMAFCRAPLNGQPLMLMGWTMPARDNSALISGMENQ